MTSAGELSVPLLEKSRQAVQEAYAARALAEQSLETPLAQLIRPGLVTCSPDTTLADALTQMQQRRIGSMLVVDAGGRPCGILTLPDLLERVTLPQVPLQVPMSQVMVQPVHSLSETDTAQDAALLMSRHGIRHVPVTRAGVAVGMVSEHDLFAMQRLSPGQVGARIRSAGSLLDLQRSAVEIRRIAAALLGQGVQARQLTALISHLNDLLARRLIEITSEEHGLQGAGWCWLALGSEGRGEQTVATDQDNALILPDGTSAPDRARYLAFAREVNQALDACGYPLCKGGIMAGEAGCCLTLAEWHTRFADWIRHGAPEDLLNASIYFDLRPLAGAESLARQLQAEVVEAARATPRFQKQLALNALSHAPPIGWRGNLVTDARGTLDLKLQGTAIFVDAARLYALAHGVLATGTRERLLQAGRAIGLEAREYQAWIAAFEFLQMLRLRTQLGGRADPAAPNSIEVATLNNIDRRILKECLRAAGILQQRLRLDYDR